MTEPPTREIAAGAEVEGGFGSGLFGLAFEEGAESSFSGGEGEVDGDCGVMREEGLWLCIFVVVVDSIVVSSEVFGTAGQTLEGRGNSFSFVDLVFQRGEGFVGVVVGVDVKCDGFSSERLEEYLDHVASFAVAGVFVQGVIMIIGMIMIR